MESNKNIVLQLEKALWHFKSTPSRTPPPNLKKQNQKKQPLNKAGTSDRVLAKGRG